MILRSLVAALLLLPCARLGAAGGGAGPARTNIVVIVADDLGYADLGCQGSREIPTPHIDSLARDGARFTSAYVSAPVCLPSRMGLITGRHQQRFGVQTLGEGNASGGLPTTEVTLPELLKRRGYATAIVGKWHMGNEADSLPTTRGFDEFYGFLGGAIPYLPGANERQVFYRNRTPIAKPAHTTDAFGDEAVAFINRQAGPFFLYLAFNAVHVPMETIPQYEARFAHVTDPGRRIYDAMTSALDDNVGRVLAALRDRGLADNTLVIFLSDNGGAPQNWSDNRPLRAGKYELYEGGLRVPFLVRWPAGGVAAGQQRPELASALDVFPTVLAAAGEGPSSPNALDGVSLLPLLTGKSPAAPHDRLFWRYGPYMAALREGDWKLVKVGKGANKNPAWELYDLAADISEQHDLAKTQPERVARLAAVFEAWDRTIPPASAVDPRLLEGKIWWEKRALLPGQKGRKAEAENP